MDPEENGNDNDNDNTHGKLDLLILNNGWNDKNEILIVSIGENAAAYKWMHEKSNSKYLFYNKLLSITIIIFNTVLTTQTFIPNENEIIAISKKIFIYIVTLLSVVNNFLKYEELAANHLNAIKQFSEMYHDIQQQMCMYRKDRENASQYIKKVIKNYDTLIVTSPDINSSVLNEFKKKFKNSDISMPDIADKIQKIEIITHPTNIFSVANNVVANNKDIDIESQTDLRSQNKDNSNKTEEIIQNSFIKNSLKIDGDLCDEDIPSLSIILKKKAMNASADYEYNRLFKDNN